MAGARANSRSMEGKIALVTGASSGIGRASAIAFAQAGARVVVADVAVAPGEETAHSIATLGGESIFVKTDVADAASVESLIERIVKTFGRLDYAHNNAGLEGSLAATADETEENWDRVIDVNLKGVWLCLKYEIPPMLNQGGGAIVNTASVSGMTGFPPLLTAYVASKFGVVGLTRVTARAYASAGIRVNAVSPGAIDTPMLTRIGVGADRLGVRLVAENPAGRLGAPEEVAQTVIWLCSDAASFVTGQALVVDGGFLA